MSQVKNKVYTFLKMIKDPINAKTPEGAYYHAHNLRFITSSNEINGGFHYEKGNKLSVHFPRPKLNLNQKRIDYAIYRYDEQGDVDDIESKFIPYKVEIDVPVIADTPRNEIERQYFIQGIEYKESGEQKPLGYCITTKGVIVITTDNNGFDCIWLINFIEEDFDIKLVYMRDMGLSTDHPIEMINNYETEKVDKIYWLDGIHQLRHLNLEQSIENGDENDLIDSSVLLIEALSQAELTQPIIDDISYGGTHTSGMIQYAYVLYKLNGSQTMLSPVSELVPLGRGIQSGGGEVNEVVGASPIVKISNIDTIYDNIMVYAIKYTSYYGTPSVTIISDQPIPDNGELIVYDNGYSLATSSIEEVKLINSSLNFPSSITSKDNSLFLANYKENNFKVKLDVRAYQFPKLVDHSARVYDNIFENEAGELTGTIRDIHSESSGGLTTFTDDPDDEFDSVNLDYDYYKYKADRTTLGGEGKYLYFEIASDSGVDPTKKYLKDNEIYRLGIIFYNAFGQSTKPMWICDFKSKEGNLKGKPNILKFGLKPEFFDWLENQQLDEYSRPVGYKLLTAERTNSDKTILASGLITSTIINNGTEVEGSYLDTFHETYDSGKRVRVKADKLSELNDILKTKPKSPTPAFRNSWIDPSKTDHEILFNGTRWDGLKTRLLDSPLQKASHYRNLYSALIEGVQTVTIKYLTEFPVSKDKPNRYWNYQDSKLMQLYSPEILFNNVPTLPEDCVFNVKYAYRNVENYNWIRLIDTTGGGILTEWKVKNRLSTQVNVDFNSNINSVEYIIPSSGLNPFEDMNHYHHHPETIANLNGNIYGQGWARSGMFSNFWGDEWGVVRTVVPVQLFYRRYGNKVESMINLESILPQQNSSITLPNLPIGNIVGLTSYQNDNGSNIIIEPEIVESFPNVTHAVMTTNMIPASVGSERSTITMTSGINGSNKVISSLGNKTQNLIDVTTIDITNLSEPITITNSATLHNENDDGIEGTVNYNVNLSLYNEDELLTSYSINNVVTYSFWDIIGDIIEGIITSNDILTPNNNVSYPIYGRPEYSKRGQSLKAYNGDGYFRYSNTLRNTNANDLGGLHNDNTDKAIRSFNSEGAPCITFVLNPEAKENNLAAISYEDLMWESNFSTNNFRSNVGSIYGEIVRSKRDIYLGGIYGGNSYENKLRTNYLEIGEYRTFDNHVQTIDSPGDTFVQDFRFLRMSRGSVTKLTPTISEIEEILEYPTETTIDLLNRNDQSFLQWDSDFSYLDTDYHKYNKVYSQPNLFTTTRNLEYNFKEVDKFNASIRGSKKKINGEKIDSWLQPLVNETLDLDGKYGSINKLINLNDTVFAMQDRGISVLAINPKIQYSEGTNNATLQLGTGRLLDDYNYVSVMKGSLKWNCISTEEGIFFVDLFTKTLNVIDGEGVQELSVSQGFKMFSMDNIDYDKYKYDNPLISKGISMGYDPTRKDVYFTLADNQNKMTFCYNVVQQGFSSFYDYHGTMYIPYKGELYIPNPNNQSRLYKSFAGEYNVFYEENKESSIEFIVQPEPHVECTFNNLEYKDEASNSNQTEVVKTFEKIRVTNEFQDSGEINLKPKFNIRKLNRKWRLNIPRDNNKVNRIRNNWAKIRLSNRNLEKLNHKVDDIILYYNPNYKIFR